MPRADLACRLQLQGCGIVRADVEAPVRLPCAGRAGHGFGTDARFGRRHAHNACPCVTEPDHRIESVQAKAGATEYELASPIGHSFAHGSRNAQAKRNKKGPKV